MARLPSDPPRKPAASRTFKTAAKPQTPPETPTSDGDRIAKVLSRAGVASRRDAERMIAEGRITVNGKVIETPAVVIKAKDKVLVDGVTLAPPEPPRLWLYNKPEGLVTSTRDELGRPTVFDYLPEDMPRVMTVGRLDLTSEGLLLLTNDGELKRKLELPSTGWLRKYRVRVNGRPMDTDFEPLRAGIVIDHEEFQPMMVALDRQQGANAWLTVGIREGRNREVRRAMEAIGYTVNRLIRVSYGPFQLGELRTGEISEVRPRMLRDQLGLEETPAAPTPPAARPTQRARPEGGKPNARPGARSQDDARGPIARGKTFGARTQDDSRSAAPAYGKPARGSDDARGAISRGKTFGARMQDDSRSATPAYGKPARGSDDARGAIPRGKTFGARMQDDSRSAAPAYGKPARGSDDARGPISRGKTFGARTQDDSRSATPAYGKPARGSDDARGAAPRGRPSADFKSRGPRSDADEGGFKPRARPKAAPRPASTRNPAPPATPPKSGGLGRGGARPSASSGPARGGDGPKPPRKPTGGGKR